MKFTPNLNRKQLDRLFTVAIIIVFAVVIIMTFSLSETAGSVPRLISIIGIILSVISLITDFKKGSVKEAKKDTDDSDEKHGISFSKCFAFIILYLVAMIFVGFIVSTLLMLIFMPILLNHKNLKADIIFAVITTAVFYLSFTYLFNVQLPVGKLFELFL
jgi:putative tricarboxylic transport membrane protein